MTTAAKPTRLGPARAERLARSMYPTADSATYKPSMRRGELVIVRERNLIRIISYRDLDAEFLVGS
jgi:hypothetical protein